MPLLRLRDVLIIVFWVNLLVVLVCNVPVQKNYEGIVLPTFRGMKLHHTLMPEKLCVLFYFILSVF